MAVSPISGSQTDERSAMDEVQEAVARTKKEWEETYATTEGHVKAIEHYGRSSRTEEENANKISLPRLNGLAQDGLALLNSLLFDLDLLAPQLPTDDQVHAAKSLLDSWRNQHQKYISLISQLVDPFSAIFSHLLMINLLHFFYFVFL